MSANLLMHVSDTYVPLLFAFIGGYIDAAGYLKLEGVFTSSITGNLVVACASVSKLQGVICRSLCSISFAFGAYLVNFISVKLKITYGISPAALASFLVSLEGIMFIIIWIVGHYKNNDINEAASLDSGVIVLMACLMGFAMGIQNGALREGFVNFPPTTVMTSTLVNVSATFSSVCEYFLASHNIIQLQSIELQNSLKSNSTTTTTNNESNEELIKYKKNLNEKLNENISKLILLGRPLISFLAGAVIGALLMFHIQFWSMFFPLFLTSFVVVEILWKQYNVFPLKTTSNDPSNNGYQNANKA